MKKNLITAIPFAYDVEKNANNTLKKTRENFGFDRTWVYQVSNSQNPQIPNQKKVMAKRRIFPAKSKKIKKRGKNYVAHVPRMRHRIIGRDSKF